MTRARFLICLNLFLISAAVPAAQSDPATVPKVGDFAVYKAVIQGAAKPIEIEQRLSVTRVTDQEVVVKLETQENDKKTTRELKFPAKAPINPFSIAGVVEKKIDSGSEDVGYKGKPLHCDWRLCEVTYTVGDGNTTRVITNRAKIWTCAQVPITGFVKRVEDDGTVKTRIELIDFGSAP